MAVAVWWLPNARADGLGASLRSTVRGPHVVAATVWVAVLALPFGMPGVVAVIAAAATAVVIGLRAVRALGGATGDVYGAVAEVSFASVLVTQVATA
jgi:adenosylcobinamide-GDP ribazoletransferase